MTCEKAWALTQSPVSDTWAAEPGAGALIAVTRSNMWPGALFIVTARAYLVDRGFQTDRLACRHISAFAASRPRSIASATPSLAGGGRLLFAFFFAFPRHHRP